MRKKRYDIHSTFIQCHSMSEEPNVVVDFRERQSARNYADGTDRVPDVFRAGQWYTSLLRASDLPNTHKFNIDVNRKGFLEGCTLLPPKVIVLGVHLVRKRDLLIVAPRYQTDFVEPEEIKYVNNRRFSDTPTKTYIPASARAV